MPFIHPQEYALHPPPRMLSIIHACYLVRTLPTAHHDLSLMLADHVCPGTAAYSMPLLMHQATLTCRPPLTNQSVVSAATLAPLKPKAMLITAVATRPQPSMLRAENLAPSTPPANLHKDGECGRVMPIKQHAELRACSSQSIQECQGRDKATEQAVLTPCACISAFGLLCFALSNVIRARELLSGWHRRTLTFDFICAF